MLWYGTMPSYAVVWHRGRAHVSQYKVVEQPHGYARCSGDDGEKNPQWNCQIFEDIETDNIMKTLLNYLVSN
jgi:hypothetical protein